MRRADRLFRIVQLLRSSRLTTARALARKLEVSERTIYRDIRDLQLSGTPIEGEAGVGYTLRREFDIPPLMFDRSEIVALVFGARMVKAWGGTAISAAATSALARIEAVLPADLRNEVDQVLLYAPGYKVPQELRDTLDTLHAAATARHILVTDYSREDGQTTRRRIRPLGLYFWGEVWTLVGWCELREGFRTFRADRMHNILSLEETFDPAPGRTLPDYLRNVVRLPEKLIPRL